MAAFSPPRLSAGGTGIRLRRTSLRSAGMNGFPNDTGIHTQSPFTQSPFAGGVTELSGAK